MKKSYSDEAIINGLRSGENLIIEYFNERYKEKVIKYVLSNKGNKQEAEDVYQDSFVKLFQIIMKKEFKLMKSLEMYFLTIYKNTWRYYINLKSRHNHTDEFQEELLEEPLNSFDEYEQDQLHKLVWQQYKRLNEDCQTVLDMYYFKRRTMNEIAYEMSYKNEQIAKNKKCRCMDYLKEQIKNQVNYKLLIHE